MAVVTNFENVVARSSTGEIREAPTYKRTFTVRCDNPDTSMVDIANAPGIKYGDPHPHDRGHTTSQQIAGQHLQTGLPTEEGGSEP